MKRISKFILLLSGILAFSCAEDYLDTLPTDAVSETAVFQTTENAMAALNGIHRSLYIRYDSQGQPGEGGVMIMRDNLGEDVVNTTIGNGWFIAMARWTNHINENSADVRFVWRFYYKVIGNANMIIANIDDAQGPQALKDEIKGQAYAYRAWAHFQLVQLFGGRFKENQQNDQLGVAIVLEPITEGIARSTVEEVYAQVNADLDEAVSLLGTSRNAKSHLNINVVKGIKARVALTQGRWTVAAQNAGEARAGFSLMSHEQMLEGFNNTDNPEWIWGSRQIDDQQTFFASFFAYMSLNFNSTNIRTNPKAINRLLYENLGETDIRRNLWDPTGEAFSVPSNYTRRPYMNAKFLAKGEASSVGDVPYMRAAEMYLIESEALARSGNDAGAAEVLFQLISSRDPGYQLSTSTGDTLLEEILIQRRLELWGEGFRFTDLKRLNQPLDRTGANHEETVLTGKFEEQAGTNNWQWAIPISELNANPEMVKNP